MDELRKALEIFALRNAEGAVSDAVLEKACEAYKARSEFVDDYEYSLYVTKSLYDHLHGVKQDPDIVKAIMPGQTKVVDGVVYIWTLTPNAKTTYDGKIEDAVKEAVKNLDDEVNRLQKERAEAFKVYQEKSAAARKVSANSVGDPDKDIYAAIYQSSRSYDEVLGVYAALQGYDAMIQPNGNRCGNSFMIVFNRSKIITRK